MNLLLLNYFPQSMQQLATIHPPELALHGHSLFEKERNYTTSYITDIKDAEYYSKQASLTGKQQKRKGRFLMTHLK